MANNIFKIPVNKKEFVLGKCVYSANGDYYTKSDFENAILAYKDTLRNSPGYLYLANATLGYLKDEEAQKLMSDPRIGKVISISDKEISVAIDDKYSCSSIFKKFYKNDSSVMEVDFEFLGNIDDDHRLSNFYIAKFNLFINPRELYGRNGILPKSDIITVELPLFLKPDDNGRYYNPEWGQKVYYTKDRLKSIVEQQEFKDRLDHGIIPLVTSLQFDSNGMPLINSKYIAGRVSKVDIENNKIEFITNKFNFHSQIFVNHRDLIGKELFATALFLSAGTSSALVDKDGNPMGEQELLISDIFCYTIKRVRNKDNG